VVLTRKVLYVGGGYHPPVEEYLETILGLEEAGITPMRARIVERLGVSAPAVSETVRRLERDGYLTLTDARAITLTAAGRTYATSIMRRHRLAERLLIDVLKVPWSQVHEEAGRLEHAISPWLETHLVELLGDPATCPHGNPIPGSANTADYGKEHILANLPAGSAAVVRRIDEQLEGQHASMQTLESEAVLPGRAITVVSRDASKVHLSVDGRAVDLELAIAERVFASLA
jgi:DtxR family Mn-dependent transcriptional regulator